jgi:hypothetical protein
MMAPATFAPTFLSPPLATLIAPGRSPIAALTPVSAIPPIAAIAPIVTIAPVTITATDLNHIALV